MTSSTIGIDTATPDKEAKPMLYTETQEIFIEAGRLFPDDFVRQAQYIIAAYRPAGLSKNFQPKNMAYEYEKVKQEKKKQKQQAIDRENQRKRQAQQEEVEKKRLEEKKKKELAVGQDSCSRLEQELESLEFHKAVEDIHRQWSRYSRSTIVFVSRLVREPNVTLHDNRMLNEDRSKVGIKVYYYHTDLVSYKNNVERVKKDIYFGIGYFGRYDFDNNIRDNIQGDLERGVKAYFVQANRSKVVLPITYPGALQTIYDRILTSANSFDPSVVIPEANKTLGLPTEEEIQKRKRITRRRLLVGLGITVGVVVGLGWLYHINNSPGSNNAIQIENCNTGSSAWRPSPAGTNLGTAIQAWCDQLSYSPGDTVHFYASVSTGGTSYTVTIYRLGSYQLLGGSLKATINNAAGTAQGYWDETNQVLTNCPTAVIDSTTHCIESGWTSTDSWTIPANAVTGVYLAVFTDSGSNQCCCSFVVKGNARADYAVIRSEFSECAYNNWGAYSFYYGPNQVGNNAATKVSFNRPQVQGLGGGALILHEIAGIKWLENQGYNLSYLSQLDVHTNPGQLLNYKAVIWLGHSEYWTKENYDQANTCVAAGIGQAFLGANDIYWQVRLEASSTNVANRTVTCYKVQSAGQPNNYGPRHRAQPLTNDPYYGVDNTRVTCLWRDPLLNRPEAVLKGGGTTYGNYFTVFETQNIAWTVDSGAGSNPLLTGTGLVAGSSYGIDCVGYEWDNVLSTSPANVQILGSTFAVGQGGVSNYANTTFYVASSGARVFSAGSINWVNALDTYRWITPTQSGNRVSPQIQIFMANVMQQLVVDKNP